MQTLVLDSGFDGEQSLLGRIITFDVVASGHVDGVRASGGIRTLAAKMLKQEHRVCLGGAFRYFDPGGETTEALDTPVRIRAAAGQGVEIPPDQHNSLSSQAGSSQASSWRTAVLSQTTTSTQC